MYLVLKYFSMKGVGFTKDSRIEIFPTEFILSSLAIRINANARVPVEDILF